MITDKTLRTVCKPVEESDNVEHIIKDMQTTMYAQKDRNPVGIAANQIGYDKRVILVNTSTTKEVMINPEIVKSSKQMNTMEESCLSYDKDVRAMITRSKQVTVMWTNRKGKLKNQKFRALDARVIQHEIDHLNAKTIKDYLVG